MSPTLEEKKLKTRHCGFSLEMKLTLPCVFQFIMDNFLILGLLFAIFFSLVCPWPGEAVESVTVGSWHVFQTINIITIFIISGLTLKTKEVKETIRQWFSFIVGIITILFITPCAAFALVALPLQPQASKYGLAIFALTPTTVASGVVLVTQALGNPVLALALTIVTNILSVFIIPYSIKLVISAGANSVGIDPVSLMIKLIMTILLPVLIGKGLRECFTAVEKFADTHKKPLSLINNGSLICIVWQVLSAGREEIVHTPFGSICILLLSGILLHIAYLIVNFILIKATRLPFKEGISVLIMGSEKTLPMAVTVISFLPATIGTKSQLTMPCVLAHISQVLIDAFLCGRLGKRKVVDAVGVDAVGVDAATENSDDIHDKISTRGDMMMNMADADDIERRDSGADDLEKNGDDNNNHTRKSALGDGGSRS